jgi:hypothetical protein
MKTSEIFQRIFETDLTDVELETIELLEESFTDITPENSTDYLPIDKYFALIGDLFPYKQSIKSQEIRMYIKQLLLNDSKSDLLFLDGLNSLAECLDKYGGNDDLKSFEIWFNEKIKAINA